MCVLGAKGGKGEKKQAGRARRACSCSRIWRTSRDTHPRQSTSKRYTAVGDVLYSNTDGGISLLQLSCKTPAEAR